jgi:hypothetical protein
MKVSIVNTLKLPAVLFILFFSVVPTVTRAQSDNYETLKDIPYYHGLTTKKSNPAIDSYMNERYHLRTSHRLAQWYGYMECPNPRDSFAFSSLKILL